MPSPRFSLSDDDDPCPRWAIVGDACCDVLLVIFLLVDIYVLLLYW